MKTTHFSPLLFTVALCGFALTTLPQKAHAFLGMKCPSQDNCLLVCALTQIGKQSNRDIVVLDKNKTILADTVSQNIGTKYPHDKKNEVTMTLADGRTRTFVEKSVDYPKGIKETVYAVRNKKGQIIGALIVSSEPTK